MDEHAQDQAAVEEGERRGPDGDSTPLEHTPTEKTEEGTSDALGG